MRTNKPIISNGLLLFAACSVISGCVDDKYDLSDIDTTSRFTVNNLTVPVNLSEIKLDKVIKLEDNENISVIDNEYVIRKGGNIESTEFDLGQIHVAAPTINPSLLSVTVPDLPPISGIEIPFPETKLPDVALQTYDLELANVDKALKKLTDIKTVRPIEVEVTLSVPSSIITNGNTITFKNIVIQLPWGLMTNDSRYDAQTGKFVLDEIDVDASGKAILKVQANGIELGDRGLVEGQKLNISGNIGIESGYITGTIRDLSLPNPLVISVDYKVSDFDIASFSGSIDYRMDDISIAPISLSDLPDFLNDPQTNIILANPEITVDITNPVAKYGLVGQGRLTLTSDFKDGTKIPRSSDVFTLADNDGDGICRLVFTPNAQVGNPEMVKFSGLGYVLTVLEENPPSMFAGQGQGLPNSISVAIENLGFAGDVVDFPLGNIGSATGDYVFNAPLGFETGSTVIYETTEGDWGSDDLDKVNIKTIHLTALCSTDLPVGLRLAVFPIDKEGKDIPVREGNAGFLVPANAAKEPVSLTISAIEGSTISGFDGVRFEATIGQNSPDLPGAGGDTAPLGPDLQIKLDDLRVTVDGYYETDF